MIYREQTPNVYAAADDVEPVRVEFSDVTLCLTLVEASWLAANVGRIIREVEWRNERTNFVPMDSEGLTRLDVGREVLVRDDAGNEATYKVRRSPWQLGHGQWVIGLAGISGGYALERVVGVRP